MGGNCRNKTVTFQISQAIMKKRKENPKTSLRKMAKYIEKEQGIKISHNTIKNWLN
jgi:hypothetical protein